MCMWKAEPFTLFYWESRSGCQDRIAHLKKCILCKLTTVRPLTAQLLLNFLRFKFRVSDVVTFLTICMKSN